MAPLIYVASSWRNDLQPSVVDYLRAVGFRVYDFRAPENGVPGGFHWSEISPDWRSWTFQEYQEALDSPKAGHGFDRDFGAMQDADACVLVLPCNRSAHLEAGWFVGVGKPLVIYRPEHEEPELMYRMASLLVDSIEDLQGALEQVLVHDHSPEPPSCS